MIALVVVCQNSSPLFCASRKSNQFTAVCIRPILICMELFSVRAVCLEVAAPMCPQDRVLLELRFHLQQDLFHKWTCNRTIIPKGSGTGYDGFCRDNIHIASCPSHLPSILQSSKVQLTVSSNPQECCNKIFQGSCSIWFTKMWRM